jgi:hypothetical protein
VFLYEGRKGNPVFMSFKFSLPLFNEGVCFVWLLGYSGGQTFQISDEIIVSFSG